MSRARRDGLTLLEVLAAFLIFSLVFSVLVGSSQTAVQRQGLSLRDLEASELAAARIADIEIALLQRSLPALSEEPEEEEIDGFVVRVRAEPLLRPSAAGGAPFAPVSETSGRLPDALALLSAQAPPVAEFAQRYDVEVEWTEGVQQRILRRTTFGFDWAGAKEKYADLFAAGGSSDESGSDPASDADGDRESGRGSDDASANRNRRSDGNGGSGAGAADSGSAGELEALRARGCAMGIQELCD